MWAHSHTPPRCSSELPGGWCRRSEDLEFEGYTTRETLVRPGHPPPLPNSKARGRSAVRGLLCPFHAGSAQNHLPQSHSWVQEMELLHPKLPLGRTPKLEALRPLCPEVEALPEPGASLADLESVPVRRCLQQERLQPASRGPF